MKALKRRLKQLKEDRERAALISCRLIDALNSRVTPKFLNSVQDALRVGLLDVEARIRSWDDREDVRQRKIKSLKSRRGGGSSTIREHLEGRAAYLRILEEYRQQFRQFGDAVAWIVLRHDSRTLVPLFAERTHHLGSGVGIVGPVQIISDASSSGKFLVIDNDLTRCLGVGDITVVRAPYRGETLPLSLEIKSKLIGSELAEGAQMTISLAGPVYGDTSHADLHRDFAAALGMIAGLPSRESAKLTAQIAEMHERAEMLLRITGDRPLETLGVQKNHARSIRNVLERTLMSGSAYDIPEKGIAFVAVRNRSDDNGLKDFDKLLQRLQRDGFPKGEPALTIADLSVDDRLSPFVPPIALWPIPAVLRGAMLSGNVFFGCVFSSSVWADALRVQGLSLEENANGWIVIGGRQVVELDRLEVLRIQFGIAFSGVSPQDLARALRALADASRNDDASKPKLD